MLLFGGENAVGEVGVPGRAMVGLGLGHCASREPRATVILPIRWGEV